MSALFKVSHDFAYENLMLASCNVPTFIIYGSICAEVLFYIILDSGCNGSYEMITRMHGYSYQADRSVPIFTIQALVCKNLVISVYIYVLF